MKFQIKFILTGLLLAAFLIFMNHCKSSAPKEVLSPIPNDTTIAVDTEKTATVPHLDTVALQAPLTLIITNLTSETAPVIVGVYGTSNKFPDPKDQLKEYKFKPHGKKLIATITNLKFDTYALAIYQDVNSNGKIDKNVIGVPTEPYAFSNNFKPTVKAPGFANCKFDYNDTANIVTMNMIR